MVSKKKGKSSGKELDDFLIEIGKRLKKRRIQLGYSSYEQFAFEKGIGRAQYGKYERGTEDLRISSLAKILEALDVRWDDFFRGL